MTLIILWSALPVISKVFCVCVLLNSKDVLLSSRETPDVWSEGMSNYILEISLELVSKELNHLAAILQFAAYNGARTVHIIIMSWNK